MSSELEARVAVRRERADYDARVPTLLDRLYEQVYANPDDDGPRVVLADHLSELGDPLGEFIAIQLAEPHGPTGLAKGRAKQLKRHYEKWLPPGVQRSTAVFSRGFLHSCRWTAPTDASHRAWRTVEELACATFPGLAEFDRSELFAGAPLPRIKELSGVDSGSFAALCAGQLKERLPGLRTYYLPFEQLTARLSSLVEFRALESLELVGTELLADGLALLCRSLAPSVRSLRISEFSSPLSLAAARDAIRALPKVTLSIGVDRERLCWFELEGDELRLCHRRASNEYQRRHLAERARREGLEGVPVAVD
jgi:uncharacterized protein (TIGR02996 family)